MQLSFKRLNIHLFAVVADSSVHETMEFGALGTPDRPLGSVPSAVSGPSGLRNPVALVFLKMEGKNEHYLHHCTPDSTSVSTKASSPSDKGHGRTSKSEIS